MDHTISLERRRISVVLNIISVILLVFVFELIKFEVFSEKILGFILLGLLLIIAIVSFIYVFGITGVWKMSHQKLKNLDERQIQVVLNSIRISYSIFVIFTLVIIYVFALLEKGPVDVVIAASLLYLAHILPASIMAWTEKVL
jgi:hypothetical protein